MSENFISSPIKICQKWLGQEQKCQKRNEDCEMSDFFEKCRKFESLFILETVISVSFSFQYYYNMEIFWLLHASSIFWHFFTLVNKKSRILKKFRHFYKWINLLTFSYPSIFQCVHYCGPIRIVRIFLMAGECVYLWQSRKEKNIELNDGIAQYGICSTTRETIQEFRIGAKMGCSKT